MIASDEDFASDDDASDDDAQFAFPDPVEEVAALRRGRATPDLDAMSADERRVYEVVQQDAQRAMQKQMDSDAALAQQMMLDEASELAERALQVKRGAFARRFECCVFLFDLSELQDFCDWWSGPYGSEMTAPMQHVDRQVQFHKTRLHAYDSDSARYGTSKLNGTANQEYTMYVRAFRHNTGKPWTLRHRMPCIEACQLLMAHVQLYWVQKRTLGAIRCVLNYAYGGAVVGARADMLREASEWLLVLRQLCRREGLLHALDGQAVELILKQLCKCRMPTPSDRLVALGNLDPLCRDSREQHGRR